MRTLFNREMAALLWLLTQFTGASLVAQSPPGPPETGTGGSGAPNAAPAAPAVGAADPAGIPQSFPSSRYSALFEKSPFAIASAPPEVVAPTENFATNWVLTGLSKQRAKEGKESFTVFVRSRDLSTRLVISGDHPTDDISLVSVEEAPVAAKSVAILRKGSETGRVEFDQAVVAASAPPPSPSIPGRSGATSAAPVVRNTTKPTAAIPRPGLQGSVPRPGASQVPGGAVPQTPPSAGAQEPRRRVRPIQEPP